MLDSWFHNLSLKRHRASWECRLEPSQRRSTLSCSLSASPRFRLAKIVLEYMLWAQNSSTNWTSTIKSQGSLRRCWFRQFPEKCQSLWSKRTRWHLAVDYQPRHQHMVEVASKNSVWNVAYDLWYGAKKKWEIERTREFISWRGKTQVGAVDCPYGTNLGQLKTNLIIPIPQFN